MFAGAAREAVFSNADVIRRVNGEFVPVALKAGLVNSPPNDEEGRLYREIGRSKPAPQGICVVNSAGKVLDWALMFDDDQSVLAFLDHCLQRFARFPDAEQSFAAERFMKFPGQKLTDVEDNGETVAQIEHHPAGKSCPAATRVEQGTLLARVYGRALDRNGQPVADTVRQEHYVEDRFHVPLAMQRSLALLLAEAGSARFRLSDDLARLLVNHAYLGQLDVNPLSSVPGEKGAIKECEFWAAKLDRGEGGSAQLRIEGRSETAGGSGNGQAGDGRQWQHDVKLTWEGIIRLKDGRISRLVCVARGSEVLKWGNQWWNLSGQSDVTRLPAGHAIELDCGVRYGIIGEPVADEETVSAEQAVAATGPNPQMPEEAREQLINMLGGPFIVFRERLQHELDLSNVQKRALLEHFPAFVQETEKAFQNLPNAKPEQREQAIHEHRRRCEEKLSVLIKDVLSAGQQKRLFQIQLQQAGAFALLGQNEAFAELKITDDQQQQFMNIVREMHAKIEPLIKAAQPGGNPAEIMPKVMAIRREHESRIEATLSDAQKEQWQKLLGNPFDLGN